jgi:type III secretion protein J
MIDVSSGRGDPLVKVPAASRLRMALLKTCALVTSLALAACAQVPVLQGVAEPEANRAVAALDQAGIAARKEADEGGGTGGPQFRVVVGAEEVARSVTVLHGHGLPRREEPGFNESYGAQPSLVQSASEERARSAQSVAGELARTLESVDGVLDARVHVALVSSDDRPLDGHEAPRPTASVLLRHIGARSPIDEASIRRIVAASVVTMRPDDVSVVTISRPPPTAGEARLSYVGPIAVARGSAGTLRAVLAGSIAVNVALAAGLAVMALRKRKGEDEDEQDANGKK